MRVELHCHSTASDGLLTPTELVEAALAQGLNALALTDHDTSSGFAEAQQASGGRLEVIPGVELSCRFRKRNFHLLGYFFDPQEPALLGLMEGLRQQRQTRMAAMLERLARLGIRLPSISQRTPGRAHLARAMVQAGVVVDLEEAFSKYLGQGKKGYVQGAALEPRPAIEAIQQAGGVAVMAHPGLNDGVRLLDQLTRMGMDGLELYHPRHNQQMVARLESEARRLGLLCTGGSDFHGPESAALGSVAPPQGVLEALRKAGNRGQN